MVACPIGANRYVGVWHSVPLSKDDLQGRILRRRRQQLLAYQAFELGVKQVCSAPDSREEVTVCKETCEKAARGEKLRVGGHFYTTVQRLRALRSARPGRTSHDASDTSPTSCYFAAAVRIIGKTFSAEAAAGLVPPAMCPDRTSRF